MKKLDYDLQHVSEASREESEIVFIPNKAPLDEDLKAIEFSKKVIDFLEDTIKAYNSKNDKKIKLSQAKKMYCVGARMRGHDSEYTANEWALARVNLFLRIVSGNIEEVNLDISKKTSYNKLMDITDHIVPSDEDLTKARTDSESHELDYPYENIEDLYIEEPDPCYSIDY